MQRVEFDTIVADNLDPEITQIVFDFLRGKSALDLYISTRIPRVINLYVLSSGYQIILLPVPNGS